MYLKSTWKVLEILSILAKYLSTSTSTIHKQKKYLSTSTSTTKLYLSTIVLEPNPGYVIIRAFTIRYYNLLNYNSLHFALFICTYMIEHTSMQ